MGMGYPITRLGVLHKTLARFNALRVPASVSVFPLSAAVRACRFVRIAALTNRAAAVRRRASVGFYAALDRTPQ
jgi:hypothetical protein